MNKTLVAIILLASPLVYAADIEAGKAKAVTVCAACHGANGYSVSNTIPNLAGQRAAYVEAQLQAFKEGTRKANIPTGRAAIMSAIAAQLSAEDIANVAAYFAAQGPADAPRSALLANVANSHVAFPESRESFVRYLALSVPPIKERGLPAQVRYYYANARAVEAAKAGKPLPDGSLILQEVHSAKLDGEGKPVAAADGSFVPDKLVQYGVMARDTGWGDEIPEMLRNENWNYAIFNADKQRRGGVNQAECLGCHKPLARTSYVFTLKELSAAR